MPIRIEWRFHDEIEWVSKIACVWIAGSAFNGVFDGSIYSEPYCDIKILKAPGQVLGISSGSTQAVSPTNSTNKFVVSAAVGFTGGSNYSASPSLVHTTANGMKVYSAVQGAIVAE